MIVREHVTGCLAGQPPDSGSAGAGCRVGRGTLGEQEQKHQEFCLLGVMPINSIINFKKICLWEDKNNQSLCPANLHDECYKVVWKNETTEPVNGLPDPGLVPRSPQWHPDSVVPQTLGGRGCFNNVSHILTLCHGLCPILCLCILSNVIDCHLVTVIKHLLYARYWSSCLWTLTHLMPAVL